MTTITERAYGEIAENVAATVAYLNSVAAQRGYDVAAILRNKAAFLRTKKAAHNHVRADLLAAAADRIVESA